MSSNARPAFVRAFVPAAVLFLAFTALPALAVGEDVAPANWPSPPYWLPESPVPDSAIDATPVRGAREGEANPASPGALPSGALPFFAIAPCRLVDTRGAGSPWVGDWGPPALIAGTARSFAVPAGPCPGIPASAAAYSLNFTVLGEPGVYQNAFLTAWPTGSAQPTVSTLNFSGGQLFINAAVVPAGTSGSIDVLTAAGAHLILDVNGYYAPLSAVTSLTTGATTLTGAVTLAQGSNVTITPAGQTFTIAATGGGGVSSLNSLTGAVTLAQGANILITPSAQTLTIGVTGGGLLPAGSAGYTLRHNGTAWVPSAALTNDGGTIGTYGQLNVGSILTLPATTASAGQLFLGGIRFLHGLGTNGTFLGTGAGSTTATGDMNTAVGMSSQGQVTTGSGNTSVGMGSLQSLSTGSNNVAVGYGALADNTVASANVAVGLSALLMNTTAEGNVAVGAGALALQSFGNGGVAWTSDNTAVGWNALTSNAPTSTATGIQNTAVGAGALQVNATGSHNVAVGAQALSSSTTAESNVALGARALVNNTTAGANVAVGDFALGAQDYSNGGTAWSSENTAVGFEALYWNKPTLSTNGYQNTAVGARALTSNSTGLSNVAVGRGALFTNTSGNSNVAVGNGALYTSGTVSWNVAVGRSALYNSSSGHDNVAVGDLAGTAVTSGSTNVAVGSEALSSNQTGSGNVAIGYRAGYSETASNRLHIGTSLGTLVYGQFDTGRVAIAATDPSVALDVNGQVRSRTIASASAATTVCFSATGVLGTCTSDARLKRDVVPLGEEVDVLSALDRIHGV
ncbi:hypothetical protein FBQ97_05915, partial [Acidobacteria bacterium ACD]|nr:hypothetical protein [Acidobacteria bacterium ACD]